METADARRRCGSARAVAASVLISALLACGSVDDPGGTAFADRPAVLVIGVDGLEWDIVLSMLEADRLPHLATLIERGYYGQLETLLPTFSPVVWTTIATGKGLEAHGIRHFARRLPNGEMSLFTNMDRRTKAIWNIATDYGATVNTIGWWMTYPVEAINGVMVAQTNTMEQIDTRGGKNVWKGTLLKGVEGQVHPRDRQNEMLAILEHVDDALPALTREIFGEFQFPLTVLGDRLWRNCQWAFRADAAYLRMALRLAESAPRADLTLLYFGGPDVVGHRFLRFSQPERYRHEPTPEEVANFGGVIEDYYAYIDASIGLLLSAYGDDMHVFVVSDHGMRTANEDARFDPDRPPADVNSGEHEDAPPGVFIASGPHIRGFSPDGSAGLLTRQNLESVGSVLDVTPTILKLLGIPAGDDMAGRVLSDVFFQNSKFRQSSERIATHDTKEFLSRRGGVAPAPSERERLEQLRRLGYIGDDASKQR